MFGSVFFMVEGGFNPASWRLMCDRSYNSTIPTTVRQHQEQQGVISFIVARMQDVNRGRIQMHSVLTLAT